MTGCRREQMRLLDPLRPIGLLALGLRPSPLGLDPHAVQPLALKLVGAVDRLAHDPRPLDLVPLRHRRLELLALHRDHVGLALLTDGRVELVELGLLVLQHRPSAVVARADTTQAVATDSALVAVNWWHHRRRQPSRHRIPAAAHHRWHHARRHHATTGELAIEATVGLHRLGSRAPLQVEHLEQLFALILLAVLLVLRAVRRVAGCARTPQSSARAGRLAA